MNRTLAQVLQALEEVQQQLSDWHQKAALLGAQIDHRPTKQDRRSVLEHAQRMKIEIADARLDLIDIFAEQPPELAGHSRVTDTEKSLDQLEAVLAGIIKRSVS